MIIYLQNYETGKVRKVDLNPDDSVEALFDRIEAEFSTEDSVIVVVSGIYIYRRSQDTKLVFLSGQHFSKLKEIPELELVEFYECPSNNPLNQDDDLYEENYDEYAYDEYTSYDSFLHDDVSHS